MMHVAKDYGVSGNALAKTCRKLGVPVPPRGYWAKLQHGRAVPKRPPLPALAEGQRAAVHIQPSLPAQPAIGTDPVVIACIAVQQQLGERIRVADQLRNPHQAIRDAAAAVARAGNRGDGQHVSKSDSGRPSPVLSVDVSPAARGRAFRLLDALAKALEARGYAVSGNGAQIEGQTVPIALLEKQDRTLHVVTPAEQARLKREPWQRKPPNWDYRPSGQLSIYSETYIWDRRDIRKRWSDGRTARLEDMLDDVLVGLVAIGVVLRQRADKLKLEEERRAELERQRRERERQARMEAARREDVVAGSEAWAKAEAVRRFVTEVERKAQAADGGHAEIEHWLAYATRVADQMDPLRDGLDAMLRRHEQVAENAGQEKPIGPYGYRGS